MVLLLPLFPKTAGHRILGTTAQGQGEHAPRSIALLLYYFRSRGFIVKLYLRQQLLRNITFVLRTLIPDEQLLVATSTVTTSQLKFGFIESK